MECRIPVQKIWENAVTVVCCGDTAFTGPTAVLYRSIIEHASFDRFYDLIYLHNGVDEKTLEAFRSMSEGKFHVSIRTCDIRSVFSEDGLYTENRQDISVMTYARLVIPQVLSEEYHRVLYLDGDMITFRDIAQLYDSDLGGKAMGSTVDFGFLSNVYGSPQIREYARTQLQLKDVETYTMAAVQLMDLDVFRQKYPVERLWETAGRRKWIWHDQDVINYLLQGDICLLDPAWDVICPDDGVDHLPVHWKKEYRRVLAQPYLFHFAGSQGKPWKDLTSPYAMEFWEMAGKTPFKQQLWSTLCSQESTYDQLYGNELHQLSQAKRLLRKVLPPPVNSVQRDLRNVLDTIDQQTKTTLLLQKKLRRMQGKAAGLWIGTEEWLDSTKIGKEVSLDTSIPVHPVGENSVTLVCCGDERFVAPTAVLFQSVIDHADPKRQYDLLYLHNGISLGSAERLQLLGREKENISIRTVDIRGCFSGESLYIANRENFSVMAYARLWIPQILGEDYHRALYLDGDMLVFTDIAGLYDQDLGQMAAGAVTDMYYGAQAYGLTDKTCVQRVDYIKHVVGVRDPRQYIISGMLLMDLDVWRQEDLSNQLMEAAQSYPWQWHDQDVINHVLGGKIRLLDPMWNSYDIGEMEQYLPLDLRESYKEALLSPGIFHFAGAGEKPWVRPCPRYASLFWNTAWRTPFGEELLLRLFCDLNTYDTYSPQHGGKRPMIKRLFKKILPPPVESVQRDLRTVLNAIDEQKKLNLLLMQQMDELQCQLDDMGGHGLEFCQSHMQSSAAVKVPRQRLRFEFALASHCNLNCAGCSHFAPLSEEEYPDLEQSRQAFARLSQLFDGECEYIHLMGGEPLLNPQCLEYLRMARMAFPKGDIYLMTNGVLLMQMEDTFYETCRDNDIIVSVTHYPIGLDQEGIRERCGKWNVRFEYFRGDQPQTHFQRYLLDPSGKQDPEHNYQNCPHANSCLFLHQDRMYPCGIGAHMRIAEAYFRQGMELKKEDGVDIYSVRSGRDLLYRLAKVPHRCRYCHVDRWQEQMPWSQSKKNIDEWMEKTL